MQQDNVSENTDRILRELSQLPDREYFAHVRNFIEYLKSLDQYNYIETQLLVTRTLEMLAQAANGTDQTAEGIVLLDLWTVASEPHQDNLAGIEIACGAAAADIAMPGNRYAADALSTVSFSFSSTNPPTKRIEQYFIAELDQLR